MAIDESEQPFRFLIHDRDSKFSGGFDHVFQSEGIAVIRTPVQAPNAKRARRALGTDDQERLSRSTPHLQPPPARTCAPRLHPPLQPASAASGSCTSST